MLIKILRVKASNPASSLVPQSPGWKCQQLACSLTEKQWDESPWADFAHEVMALMKVATESAAKNKFSMAGKVKMVQLVESGSRELSGKWRRFAETTGFEESVCHSLINNVVLSAMPCILHDSGTMQTVAQASGKVVSLSKEEKQVLYYCAGYVCRKLQRKFQRSMGNKAAQLFLEVVSTWALPRNQDSDEFLIPEDISQWIDLQDRGGLVHCTMPFFNFMSAVECELEKTLNVGNLTQFAGKKIITLVAGSSLDGHGGKAFSTYDVDNDSSAGANCAERFCGAWWYTSCHQSNLNGNYYAGNTYATGLDWVRWHGHYYSLKSTKMMIRPEA